MELILSSNEHTFSNNCLRYNFKQPIRFNNQQISLTNMIFYNFFENITDDFKMTVKYKSNDYVIKFQNGSYNISDIKDIVNLELREKDEINTEEGIKMVIDINRYKILIIVKEDFKLILDKNFMKLLGFSKYIINPGYNRSDLIPQIDKTKYLKIFCNIVNNKNENEFLSYIFIKNGIGDLVIHENLNLYKKQKIIGSNFNFIEICIRNQDNENITLKDFWQISVYIE